MNSQLPRHSVSVSGVITDEDGRALLIQRRDNHHWELPGGVLELGESIEDGLRREVREETGLVVEPGSLSGVYKNVSRGVIALVFRCRATGGQLTTNDEVIAFRWADEDTIRQLTTEAYAVRLLDAMRSATAASIRHHDGTHLL
ncbi:MAG: NUDIX hydrolase [Actinobacteria bacterium]|nr:NUDIX hydrolase [Actinomycetota bacterium]